jgi:hypothetical protein
MWAQRSLSAVRGESSGLGRVSLGEQLSLGGRPVSRASIGIAAAGDPEIWTKLSAEQQQWVMNALVQMNELIVKTTGTKCATWGPSVTAAGGCFQGWYNANYLPLNPSAVQLRTDGVFDEDTLCALQMMAALSLQDFPAFPDPKKRYCQVTPSETEEKKKLSTGAMVGIGVAGAAAVGGGIYLATRKKKTRKSRRRR